MTGEASLSLDAVIAQSEQQVSTVVDGETVLMDVRSGKYYKLDDIGSRVWSLIVKPIAVRTVCNQLVQEFEVEPATCETATLTLLQKLQKCNLIRVPAPG